MVKARKMAMPHDHFSALFIVPQIINRRQHRRNPPCFKAPFYFQASKELYYFKVGIASAIDNNNDSCNCREI
jgi:hypothetical protein